jgi:hypothetical protein
MLFLRSARLLRREHPINFGGVALQYAWLIGMWANFKRYD